MCGAALKACTALQAEPVVAASFTMIAFSGVNAASRRHRFSGSSSWLPGTPRIVQVRKTVGKVGLEVQQGCGGPEHYLRPLGGG